ncbi:MAG TPA: apolipoprotein N-acyltransferase [Bacteroidales bacterium]|nr:apolipoprotein N-acyltransferase [Bacteroidales bacterium]HBZ65538.1 apolipoprotein N-acyltransferase [Bacteroidales bacterium]
MTTGKAAPIKTSPTFVKNYPAMSLRKVHFLLLSLLSAVLLALGWPQQGFPGLLFIGFVPLFFIEEAILQHRERYGRFHVFRWAWLSFFVWNALTTWWIWNSTIFGAVMAIILNSLFQAIVFLAYHFVRRNLRPMSAGVLLLSAFWIGFEYLHLDWDLSWPWLNLGNGFAAYPRWIQWYEYTGVFGGSLWVICANVLIFNILKKILTEKSTKVVVPAVALGMLIMIPLVISFIMFNHYEEKGKPVEVVVVQPNNDPWSKQYGLPTRQVIDKLIRLAESKTDSTLRYVVFPESGIYDDIWLDNIDKPESIQRLRAFVKEHPHLSLIVGASTYQYYGKIKATETSRRFTDTGEWYDTFNSAICIDTTQHYDYTHKSKLVPGPERLPFPSLTRPLQDMAFDLGGTVGSLGTMKERVVMGGRHDSLWVCVPICYESIYGEFVNGFISKGARLIFVITNDGWWGNTAGHRQHLTFSSLRAIETRRDIARSANTGISAFIDQRGIITRQSKYWEEAVLRGTMHANTEITFYVAYGDYIGRLCGFTAILFILLAVTVALRKKKL